MREEGVVASCLWHDEIHVGRGVVGGGREIV